MDPSESDKNSPVDMPENNQTDTVPPPTPVPFINHPTPREKLQMKLRQKRNGRVSKQAQFEKEAKHQEWVDKKQNEEEERRATEKRRAEKKREKVRRRNANRRQREKEAKGEIAAIPAETTA